MATPKIVWKRGAFRELRTQPAVVKDVEARAERIAAACGDGFEVRSEISGGRGRARSVVLTTEPAAMIRNARDHTLLGNLDRGR